MRRRHPAAVLCPLVALVLLAAACSAGDEPDTAEGSSTPAGDAPAPDTTTPTTALPSATASEPAAADVHPAAAEQLEWVLALVAGADLTEEEYEQRFDAVFREGLPFEQFQQITAQLRTGAPYTVQEVTPRDELGLIAATTAVDGTGVNIVVHVTPDGQIDGLFFQPADTPTLDDPPASVDEAVSRLQELGTVRLVAAEVDGAACTATADHGAEEVMPLGSMFKLYVLGALVDAIAAGETSWDAELTITDELKSLPSGVLQTREAGTTVPVREAAELMIAISDNTATDLLLHHVGREAVEAAQATYGHHAPELNQPMLSTREFFALKTGDDELRQRWLDGDPDARRAMLPELAAVPLDDLDVTAFLGDPVAPDTIEWFATPLDGCRALATLLDRATDPDLAPVADILTANPGVPDEAGRWSSIAFKGGSEPGLVAAGWVVEDADGSRHAVVGSVVNPDRPIDATLAVLLLAAARDTSAA